MSPLFCPLGEGVSGEKGGQTNEVQTPKLSVKKNLSKPSQNPLRAMARYILFLYVANLTKYATLTLNDKGIALGPTTKVQVKNITAFVNTLKHSPYHKTHLIYRVSLCSFSVDACMPECNTEKQVFQTQLPHNMLAIRVRLQGHLGNDPIRNVQVTS